MRENEITMMSSFERCCTALCIGFGAQTVKGSRHDVPTVQNLLKWLVARQQDQKWLVVFDNTGDLDQLAQITPPECSFTIGHHHKPGWEGCKSLSQVQKHKS